MARQEEEEEKNSFLSLGRSIDRCVSLCVSYLNYIILFVQGALEPTKRPQPLQANGLHNSNKLAMWSKFSLRPVCCGWWARSGRQIRDSGQSQQVAARLRLHWRPSDTQLEAGHTSIGAHLSSRADRQPISCWLAGRPAGRELIDVGARRPQQ